MNGEEGWLESMVGVVLLYLCLGLGCDNRLRFFIDYFVALICQSDNENKDVKMSTFSDIVDFFYSLSVTFRNALLKIF